MTPTETSNCNGSAMASFAASGGYVASNSKANMTGTATEVKMCGTTIRLGDVMEVEYRTGREMKGGRIKGEVVELWSPELSEGHLQGRLSCGWCFHDSDRIISHTKREPANAEVSDRRPAASASRETHNGGSLH